MVAEIATNLTVAIMVSEIVPKDEQITQTETNIQEPTKNQNGIITKRNLAILT